MSNLEAACYVWDTAPAGSPAHEHAASVLVCFEALEDLARD